MSEIEAYVGSPRMAKILSVSTKTLKAWVKDGVIPVDAYIYVAGTYRFLPSATLASLHNATKRQQPQTNDGQITEQLELPFENTDGGE